MQITHDPDNKRFIAVDDDGRVLGEITYIPHPKTLTAHHTRVDEAHRGQGLARQLLGALAAYARADGRKIIPACSYAAAAFREHPDEYADVMVNSC